MLPEKGRNEILDKAVFQIWRRSPLATRREQLAKRGFATRNEDAGLFKAFRIREDGCLRLRVEVLDVFDRQTWVGFRLTSQMSS